MSKGETQVRLQVTVRESTRRRLRTLSIEEGLEMGEIADVVLEHFFGLMAAGKTPPAITTALSKLKEAKQEEADSEDS